MSLGGAVAIILGLVITLFAIGRIDREHSEINSPLVWILLLVGCALIAWGVILWIV